MSSPYKNHSCFFVLCRGLFSLLPQLEFSPQMNFHMVKHFGFHKLAMAAVADGLSCWVVLLPVSLCEGAELCLFPTYCS